MTIIGNFILIGALAEAELSTASASGFGFNSNFLEANVINIVILASGVVYLGRNFLTSALELRQQKITEALQEAEDRLHLVEGFLIAQKNIDEVVAVIKKSRDDAAENLILSTDSRLEPPAAALTGLIVKFVCETLKESVKVAVAIKLFALFAAIPLVTKYLTDTVEPSGNALPTSLLPK